jgi:hypothetical protein
VRRVAPHNSKMLAIGGTLPRDEGGSLGWLALTIAGGAAALALAAFLIRRGKPGEGSTAPGPLEVTATLVAIFGGLAGLAVQFIPGVGVHQPVPTEATMEVREVHAVSRAASSPGRRERTSMGSRRSTAPRSATSSGSRSGSRAIATGSRGCSRPSTTPLEPGRCSPPPTRRWGFACRTATSRRWSCPSGSAFRAATAFKPSSGFSTAMWCVRSPPPARWPPRHFATPAKKTSEAPRLRLVSARVAVLPLK